MVFMFLRTPGSFFLFLPSTSPFPFEADRVHVSRRSLLLKNNSSCLALNDSSLVFLNSVKPATQPEDFLAD